MFGSSFVLPSTINVKSTIHEHRAPTDDSVRLLNEMHDRVMSEIIKSEKLENNVRILAVQRTSGLMSSEFVCFFELNGQEYRVSFKPKMAPSKEEYWKELIEVFAKELAKVLILQDRTFMGIISQEAGRLSRS